MPDAVLPAFDVGVFSFVRVFLEPLVYVFEDHGMIGGVFEASENALRIRLVSVQIVIVAWGFDFGGATKRCRWAAMEFSVVCES